MSDQNPSIRRAYLVRPRQELLDQLSAAGESDLTGLCGPTVVMTESLKFEGGLEGFRTVILDRCKEAYVADIFEFEPFSDVERRTALLGAQPTLTSIFDRWWVAEEVDTLEIKTTWLSGHATRA